MVGSVDLVSERAWSYREGEPSTLIEVPAGLVERENEARGELLEHLSEFDDHLLEELIEDREPPSDEVYAICKRVLGENRVLEALIGSGLHGNGIVRVMKALRHEAPGPAALRERLQAQAGIGEAPVAVAFGSAYRKHVGKALMIRSLAPLAAGQTLAGKAAGQLTPADPRDGHHLDAVEEGAVVTAVKSDHLAAGTLLTAGEAHPTPAWHRPQPAAMSRVLAPVNERDSVKVSASLATIAEGDSALTVTQDPVTGGALVGVQGPLHLRVLRQRLKDAFGLEVEEVAPSPAYRETISKSQETAYRHKKQTGGAGQFADVKLIVAPGTRGAGFVFEEVVKGGAVPRNYIPAVETGARDAMERGPLGFPVVDVAVTLTDGQAHSVDSSDMAFRIAGRQGTRRGAEGGGAGAAAAGVPDRDPCAGAVHRRARADRRLALGAGARLRRRPGRQGLGALRGAGAGRGARGARERRAGGDAGGRLVRAGVRPLRGDAREGGGSDRAGAGEGAGLTIPGICRVQKG